MSHTLRVNMHWRTAILDHIRAAVAATFVQDDPFPHILVTDFFPAAIYSRILDCFPPSSEFEPFAYEKHASNDGQSNRKRFRLENACLETLPHTYQEVWYTIRSVLCSVALKETVFDKLRSGLSYRFKCEPDSAQVLPGFALPELFHETGGYRIKPHPDTRKKVVTMQIALPENDDKSHLGTEFYRRSIRPQCLLREPRGFEIVKTMPFLPNTAYAFVVLNTMRLKSWHGRSTLPSNCGTRNSLLNIWYQSAEHANQEMFQENEVSAELQNAA